jgi:hypothetical protein
MTGPGVSLGGDGSSLSNPALDCNTLYRAWGKPSGTYFISTPIGIRRSYCYMDIGSGGWLLVWKHSYYEVCVGGGPPACMQSSCQGHSHLHARLTAAGDALGPDDNI